MITVSLSDSRITHSITPDVNASFTLQKDPLSLVRRPKLKKKKRAKKIQSTQSGSGFLFLYVVVFIAYCNADNLYASTRSKSSLNWISVKPLIPNFIVSGLWKSLPPLRMKLYFFAN